MLRRKLIALGTILPTLILAVCCAKPVDASEAVSDKPRDTSSEASVEDVASLVRGNTDFAFELYQTIASDGQYEGENLFLSPYSVSLALAMTWAGARGDTEAEMAETLHLDSPQETLHPAFNSLDLTLDARGGEGLRLDMANSLWGQVGYHFLAEFLDTLAVNYGAGMRLVDYASEPEACRVRINEWVEDETERKIKDLIPRGFITPTTTLVLVNAIYFKAFWESTFDKNKTVDDHFTLLSEESVTVPMMNQEGDFLLAVEDGYSAVELPYVGGEVSMVIVLPDQGRFEEIEESLDRERLEDIIDNLDICHGLLVSIPRFEMDCWFSLADALSKMGMPGAFTGGADFSGMTGSRDLFIGNVLHGAYVLVNEEGTEAAAATAVVMERGMPPRFRADRPFIFLIRDVETGSILFVGRVMNPA